MTVNYNVVWYCELPTQHCCDSLIMCIHLLLGSNFHRDILERVVVTEPVIPNNPFAVPTVCAMEVQSIQVCIVTPVVPPGSLAVCCTASSSTPLVVVSIPRGERHAVMIPERISWNTNNVTNRIVNPEDTKCAWSLSSFHFDNNGVNGYKQIYELHPCCVMASLKAMIGVAI